MFFTDLIRNTNNKYIVNIFKNIPGNYEKFLLVEIMTKNLKEIIMLPPIFIIQEKF